MIKVSLNGSGFALIDDQDERLVSAYNWHADSRQAPCVYAYARPRVNGRQRRIFMHRYLLGALPGQVVDHVNGDGLDNRRQNLRLCSHSQNQANRRNLSLNTSGFKGVTWNKARKRWQASIKVNGRSIYLGLFECAEDAASVYDKAAIEHFGEFALTNISLPSEAA